MNVARHGHVAVRLQNGQVLVAGGVSPSGAEASAELYNPATGAWTFTGPMNIPRFRPTTTLLQDGRVLITGGQLLRAGPGAPLPIHDSAELYHPGTGTFTLTDSMTTRRRLHAAILLPNGQVMIIVERMWSCMTRLPICSP